MRDKIVVGDSSCFGCPIACGKRNYIKFSENESYHMEGPEFETVGMLGSNCGISSWETLLKASKICDIYGFDTINAGACISMIMEAFETNRLTLEDTNGIQMNFGNDNALLQMLEKIGKREGMGDILAKGVAEAGKILGIEDLAIHSKGQSFPVYDPRGAKAMALTYATSPKGAHHMLATTFGAELSAILCEEAFMDLDAPIVRIGGKDVPISYCKDLENAIATVRRASPGTSTPDPGS